MKGRIHRSVDIDFHPPIAFSFGTDWVCPALWCHETNLIPSVAAHFYSSLRPFRWPRRPRRPHRPRRGHLSLPSRAFGGRDIRHQRASNDRAPSRGRPSADRGTSKVPTGACPSWADTPGFLQLSASAPRAVATTLCAKIWLGAWKYPLSWLASLEPIGSRSR